MSLFGRFRPELRGRIWKPPVEQEVDSELAFHLEMLIADNVRRGMDPETARAEALRRFGDASRVGASCREIGAERDRELRHVEWLAELRQDIRYALRQLRLHRGFAVTAVLTLALGIGASTAIFGMARAVLLRPLPFPQPERLVRLFETNPRTDEWSTSGPNYLDWRERARSFSGMAAFTGRNLALGGAEEPEMLRGASATHELFGVLGVRPVLGRTFTSDESQPGAERRVAVISHGLWQRRFAGDPAAVGGTVRLNGVSHEVIGVMPPAFEFPTDAEVWLPLGPSPEERRDNHSLVVVARLAHGVAHAAASAEMRAIAGELSERFPASNAGWGVKVATFEDWLIGAQLRARVVALLAAVGLLLLMACVNVASLLLARAGARMREMTVRGALGAGRGRLARQLLTESVVLALLGAAAGVALAAAAVPVLREAGGDAIPRLDELRMDWRVASFGVLASLATGMLFGLAPALHASRTELNDVLRGGARVVGTERLRGALVVGSVALAMVLLVGAGLVGRSFSKLLAVDTGFDARGVFAARVTLPSERYRDLDARVAFVAEAAARLAALPGVAAAGAGHAAPLGGGEWGNRYTLPGRPLEFRQADWRAVTSGYFAALRIPLLRGRFFDERDARDAAPTVIVSETMARAVWPGEDPLGKSVLLEGRTEPATVVGVVGDVRDQSLAEAPDQVIYHPHAQQPVGSMWLFVRASTGDGMALANAVRREIRALDAELPLARAGLLARFSEEAAAQPRLTTLVFVLFAGTALALAVVGVYGVVSYGVARRTREIGVRMAIGARPLDVLGGVLGQGLRLGIAGVLAGLAAAFALTRYIAGILYDVTPVEPMVFAGVAGVLVASVALASLIPARVAAGVDPTIAMRAE